MPSKNTAPQSKKDIPIEIRGYVTDPKFVGYQILTNYESTYWRRLVGRDAWSLYEVLRSFCHKGNNTCNPSIRTLMDILDIPERRQLTGRVTILRGKEYVFPGLIDILQDFKLATAEVKGEGPKLRYVFHVNLTPSLLTEEQIKQLPKSLQKKHVRLMEQISQTVDKLDSVKAKKPKKGRQTAMSERQTKGGGTVPPPLAQRHPPPGTVPPKQQPYNNTHITTTEAEVEKDNNNSGEEQSATDLPKDKQDVVVALTDLGFSEKVAQRLASRYSRKRVFEKIDYLTFLQETNAKKVTNPRGWLRRAIEENYGPPDGYKPKEQREAEAAEREQREKEFQRQVEEERRREQERQERLKLERAQRLAQLKKQYQTTEQEEELWRQVVAEIEGRMDRVGTFVLKSKLENSTLLSVQDDEALIVLASQADKDYAEKNLSLAVQRILTRIRNQEVKPKFIFLDEFDAGSS